MGSELDQDYGQADKAIALIRNACPSECWPFVEALLGNPDMSIAAAERAVGWPQGAGRRALANPRVREAIGAILLDRRDRYRHIRDRALLTLAEIAFFDPADAWGNGGVKPLPEMPSGLRLAVSEYEERISATGEITRKVKFHNRVKVLELLLAHFEDPGETADAIDATPPTKFVFRGVQIPPGQRAALGHDTE